VRVTARGAYFVLLAANNAVLVCPTGGTTRTVCQLKALQQIHILSNQCLASGGAVVPPERFSSELVNLLRI